MISDNHYPGTFAPSFAIVLPAFKMGTVLGEKGLGGRDRPLHSPAEARKHRHFHFALIFWS